jgi:hypothetical protein
LSRQTHLNIAQALAIGQLRKGHNAKLLGATETARPMITTVTIHNAMESIHNLRKQGLAEVHGSSGVVKSRTLGQHAISNSSRGHPSEPKTPIIIAFSGQHPQVNRTLLIFSVLPGQNQL